MSSSSDSKTAETIPLAYAVVIYQQTSQAGQWGDRATQAQNGALMFTGWLSESFSYNAGAQYDSPFQTVVGSGLAPLLSLGGVKVMPPVLTGQIWSGSETPELSIAVELTADTDPLLEIRDPVVNLLKLVTPRLGNGGASMLSPGPYLDPNKVWDQLRKVFPIVNELAPSQSTSSGEGTQAATEQKTGTVNQRAAAKNKPASKQGEALDTSEREGSTPSDDAVSKAVASADQRIRNSLTNQISVSIGQYIYFPSVVITNVECEFHNQIGPSGWPMQATVSITFKPMFLPTQPDLATMFGTSGG